MGYFDYKFISLTPEQVAERRILLDNYANIAQFSQITVLFAFGIFGLGIRVLNRAIAGPNGGRPSSPRMKHLLESRQFNWLRKALKIIRITRWRLSDEIVIGYGSYAQWTGGIVWIIWLGILCTRDTTPDYMHLTKRFGIVAASQLPVHYLMAVKSPFSPIQLLLHTSHEVINSAHQVLGRIIITFLALHASFYLNYFAQMGILKERLQHRIIIIGLVSIFTFLLLGASAYGTIRRINYRVFLTIHVIGSTLLPMLLYFHVHHVRPYVLQCVAIQIINVALRWANNRPLAGTLSVVKDTTIVQIVAKDTKSWKPGQHFYIRLSTFGLSSYVKTNPFTISSLPEDKRVVLAARTLKGNTKHLARLSNSTVSRPIYFEGPYGHSAHLPDFRNYSRILLVGGGVGATYILPIYRYIAQRINIDNEVKLIWTVKTIADTTWAYELLANHSDSNGLHDDLTLHVTGEHTASWSSEDTELRERTASSEEQTAKRVGFTIKSGRPDLRTAVADLLSSPGRVAVLVCGPNQLTRQMRAHVGKWVRAGRDVYWHAEEFGL